MSVPLRLESLQSDESEEEGEVRPRYLIELIRAGRVLYANGTESDWEIPTEPIQEALAGGLFDSLSCFIDHPPRSWVTDYRHSLHNLFGVTLPGMAEWDEAIQGAVTVVEIQNTEAGRQVQQIFDEVLRLQSEGVTPDVGGSIVFYSREDFVDVGEEPGEEYLKVTREITKVLTWDAVFGPGTGAKLKEMLSGLPVERSPGRSADEIQRGEHSRMLGKSAGHLRGRDNVQGGQQMDEQLNDDGSEAQAQTPPVETPEPESSGVTAPAPPAPQPPAQGSEVQAPQLVVDINQLGQQIASLGQRFDQLTQALAGQEEPSVVSGMGQPPRGPGRIHGMFSDVDQVSAAYHQLMGLDPVGCDGQRYDGSLHRLTGIRELYLLLTGDRNLRGEVNLDLVPRQLAYSTSEGNADTTTMAELTRNVMNKALVAQIDLMEEYQWWRRIARIDNFSSLQDVSWVRYGGIGYSSGTGIPTVTEKAEYDQLYWEDERTTASWTKKGGYLPLSLEMIDRDDLMGWKDVPRQLAVAATVTLSSVVSALFTDNSGAGADLSDSVGDGYAFNTTRGNLLTQPLDQTNWDTAVDTMYKLSQLVNSSVSETRRIAARPQYLLVPIELESQGITAVKSDVVAGTSGDKRPTKRILPEDRVITVPHWTNADNWAAVANPALLPFAGVGFRFGDTPEIFIPGDANYMVFLHDVMPVKVRWFFAVGVIETRGGIKSNMS